VGVVAPEMEMVMGEVEWEAVVAPVVVASPPSSPA
jgi:hypothetical protein